MLHLFINISKLSLDNFFVAGLLHSYVVLCLIFFFGWNSQTPGMCIICVSDFTTTSGARSSKPIFCSYSYSTKSVTFVFSYTRCSRKLLNFLSIQIFPLATSPLQLSCHFLVSCLSVGAYPPICIFQDFLSQGVDEE